MEFISKLLDILPFLLQGAGVTLGVTAIALSVGFVIGAVLGIARVYGGPFLRAFAFSYSTIIRGLPIIVVIFIMFFVIAKFVDLPAFLAGSLALGIGSSAYQSEVLRGAIQSVPSGQFTAARAIGMTRWQAIRHIVMPQALRLAIPPWSNEVAILLKDSSLVFIVGVPEIMRRAQYVSARTLEPFVAYAAAAVIYLILVFLANRGLDWLETRYRLLT